jgi:hypothetical protein
MYTPSKVEIKLKKAEPMSWNKLDIPRQVAMEAAVDSEKKKQEIEENLPKVDVLDLSDL